MASAAEPIAPYALPSGLAGLSQDIVELVEQVQPSVVQIRVHGRGVGAGVVWDTDGGIVTNFHVVGEHCGPIQVVLSDGRSVAAEVARQQPNADLAMLEVPAGGLHPASVGDSNGLRVGQLVFAIGHPWGQPGVVTAGIVSATGEVPVRWGARPAEYIRSDVRLAPGNSGGPLIDAAGRVVGINSMIFGGDLSVAIPSRIVQRWLATSPVPAAFLGIQLRPVELRSQRARAAGLLISGLRTGGPAERAGLLLGDVLVGCDGTPIAAPESLAAALASHRPGDLAVLDVVRAGAVQRLDVMLGEAPSHS